MAAVTLGMLTLGAASPDRALTAGCTAGWALSVVVFSAVRLGRTAGELGVGP